MAQFILMSAMPARAFMWLYLHSVAQRCTALEAFHSCAPNLLQVASSSARSIHLDLPSSGPYNFTVPKPDMQYSQWGQDGILAPILRQIKHGFFVESGARDGETHSNTVYYEYLGWEGLLIEPGAEYFQIARKHRRAWAFHGALSPQKSSAILRFSDSEDGLSHLETYGSSDVQAEPLEKLLEAVDPSRQEVDFWSLDIEGSEGAVLEATDFRKVSVGLLLVEMGASSENNRRVRAVMEKNSFTDIGRIKYDRGFLDHIFINASYFKERGVSIPSHLDAVF